MTPREVFLELVRGIEDQRWGDLPRLYAEDTVVSHPLDPSRRDPIHGRAAIAAHFGLGSDVPLPPIPVRKAINLQIYETTDPEVVIAEFAYRIIQDDGTTSDFPCLFVVRVRNGEIVTSRDFIDPIGRARALGRVTELCDEIQLATMRR